MRLLVPPQGVHLSLKADYHPVTRLGHQLYLPVLASAITHRTGLIESLNYIRDATLFTGIVLLASGACPPSTQS
jgi:hypothetical protein